MRMSKVAVFGGESYMCSSGFLHKYFIPSAKYQTATGILKRQKMLNKSYFSKAKKKKLAKTNLTFIFSERFLKEKKTKLFQKKRKSFTRRARMWKLKRLTNKN